MKHKNQNLKIILIIAVFLVITIISFNAIIAYNISHPKRKPVPLFHYPTLAMNYSAITFASNDIKLKGWFIANDSNESNATIIIAHGYGGNRADQLDYALFLHKAGYNLLLFDFRAHGESERDWTSNGYYESDDIIAAVNYTKNLGFDKIAVIGISMGGKAAIIASTKTKDIDAVVADSSAAGFVDSMNLRYRVSMRSTKVFSFFVSETLVAYFYELMTGISEDDNKAVNYIDRINTPILIIHGDKDKIVPLKDAHLLYEKAKEPKFIWIVKNTGHHEAHNTHRAEYEERLLNFFDGNLKS